MWSFLKLSPPRAVALFLAVWLYGLAAPAQCFGDNAVRSEDAVRSVICGSNAIYLLLRLHGQPAEHSVIQRYLPTHEAGLSLSEIEQALQAEGLPVETRRVSVSDLSDVLREPVIAVVHFDPRLTGHYYVLTRLVGNKIEAIDATTGEVVLTTPDLLVGVWDGYVIMRAAEARQTWQMFAAVGGATAVAGGGLLARAKRRHRGRVSPKESARCRPSRPIKVAVSFLILIVTASAPASATTGEWRHPDNAGLNCLFLQLRSSGWDGSYEEFAAKTLNMRCSSFADIREVAASAGVSTRLVRMSRASLAAAELPAIVLLEPNGVGSGSFALIVDVGSADHLGATSYVTAVDGGSLRWIRLAPWEFRRAWTGHVLIVGRSRPQALFRQVASVGLAGIIAICSYFVWQRMFRTLRLGTTREDVKGYLEKNG